MKTILIIGAGFSGAVTAAQLLRNAGPGGLRVLLVNRSGRMARGTAYGTQSPNHMLNVPAGNMSALADQPDHFLDFCHRTDPGISPSSFVSRRIYGDYLECLLDEAELAAADGATLTRIVGEVTEVELASDRHSCRVVISDGQVFQVDQLVFAFGHYPPNDPAIGDPAFYRSLRYVRDPWAPSALDAIDPAQPTLLLGTGLTAVDVALSLLNHAGAGAIHAISRRGLVAQAHRVSRSTRPVTLPDFGSAITGSIRMHLKALRKLIGEIAEYGQDWRDVMAALRPYTQTLWQGLSEAERKRFLRHLQAHWDNHRHRVAPAPHARFRQAIDAGQVRIMTGRVLGYREQQDRVTATIRPRGATGLIELQIRQVINCTGPSSDLKRVDDRLVRHLLSNGLIRPDALGLGLDVSDSCQVVDANGQASGVLYYIGPLLKAHYWEATAVPELRVFAQNLAKRLLQQT